MHAILKTPTYDFLVEWAVWGHLQSKTDLELILLKGHLLLESILDSVLGIAETDNYSFHRKVIELENTNRGSGSKQRLIIDSLKAINKLRNRLAHELYFEVNNGELELWAMDILCNLNGTKFTKYTVKTKIVHSFSILSKSLYELKE